MQTNLPRVALIPAKGASKRVKNKNRRIFHQGLCLVEWKIEALRRCPSVDSIFVYSNDTGTLDIADLYGSIPLPRADALCTDEVPIGTVIAGVLEQVCRHLDVPDALVYWAHPTSPFVHPSTIEAAFSEANVHPDSCIVGMERLQDFFWTADGPLNYEPARQPRSQDLPPLFRVAGGIHMGRARQMMAHRSHTFSPRRFVEMSRVEALDINTPDDWEICAALAATVLPAILTGK